MRTQIPAALVIPLMTLSISAADAPSLASLEQMTARFAPVPLRVDTSKLSAGDRAALASLIQAGRVVNHIFLQQLWHGNLALYDKLQQDQSALGKARLEYF